MANLNVNVDLNINDENTFVSAIAIATVAESKEVQVGFVVPKSLFNNSIVETLFTVEGDKFGFYVTILGFFINFSDLSKIAKDETIQRRILG